MKIEIKNKRYLETDIKRHLRVINDDTGEYYDVCISGGTSDTQRAAIADNIHVLADEVTDYKEKFEWTRIVIFIPDPPDDTAHFIGHSKSEVFPNGDKLIEIHKVDPQDAFTVIGRDKMRWTSKTKEWTT